MSCEICGRNSCCSSFHSIEEQQSFDDVADKIKERMREVLSYNVNRLDCEEHPDYKDGVYFVQLEEVIEIINDYQ